MWPFNYFFFVPTALRLPWSRKPARLPRRMPRGGVWCHVQLLVRRCLKTTNILFAWNQLFGSIAGKVSCFWLMKENLNYNTGVVYAWEICYFLSNKLLPSKHRFPDQEYWIQTLADIFGLCPLEGYFTFQHSLSLWMYNWVLKSSQVKVKKWWKVSLGWTSLPVSQQ